MCLDDQILSMVLQENGERGKEGQAKGHLLEPLTPKNSWPLFWIKWKGYPVTGQADEWVREEDLSCPVPVRYTLIDTRPGGAGLLVRGCNCLKPQLSYLHLLESSACVWLLPVIGTSISCPVVVRML